LLEDENTKVITLISKPPHESVLAKIKEVLKDNKKPVVGCLLGADESVVKSIGAYPVNTLEEAALLSVSLSKGIPFEGFRKEIEEKRK